MKGTVSYSKVFPVAQYGINERVGMDFVEIEDGETASDALSRVKREVMNWAKENISAPVMTEITSFPVVTKIINEDKYVGHMPSEPEPIRDSSTEQFLALKKTIEEAPTKEMALSLLSKTIFRYNIDLKKIANGKAESIG